MSRLSDRKHLQAELTVELFYKLCLCHPLHVFLNVFLLLQFLHSVFPHYLYDISCVMKQQILFHRSIFQISPLWCSALKHQVPEENAVCRMQIFFFFLSSPLLQLL